MRYWDSFLSTIILSGLLLFSFFVFGELNPVISAIIGLAFSIPVALFVNSYMGPVLEIKKEIESRVIYPGKPDPEIPELPELGIQPHKVSRIFIENTGRGTAKGCKGYIVVNSDKGRVCWSNSAERPNATINVKDKEPLDFCAFSLIENAEKCIVPTEEGWNDYRFIGHKGLPKRSKVLITAENAELLLVF